MTKILVVEDEPSFSDALSYLLGREGFDISVADTGTKAVEEFERHGADLILLDLMLPGLSGTEVCRQIRSKSNVPIIMLTAKDTEVDKVVGLELGADDYVTKPFSIEELALRVEAILRRTQGTQENNILRCGPISIDIDQHLVKFEDEIIELSPTEYNLLNFLVERKNKVVRKDALLNAVWGIDFENNSTVVETYISYLRKKFHRGGFEGIKTVRGVGFQIVERL